MQNAVLSLKNIHQQFKHTVALSEVRLEVPRGIVFALLGENGAS